jgi:hypothetical protein
MQVFPFLYPTPQTVAIITYFSNRYRSRHTDSDMHGYFAKAKGYWPKGRFACERQIGKQVSLALKNEFAKNTNKWVQWAMRNNSPFILREILKNQPYRVRLDFRARYFRPVSLQALCDWIIEHQYVDLFAEWLSVQSWTPEQLRKITLGAAFQKHRSVVVTMIKALRVLPDGEDAIESMDRILSSHPPKRASSLIFSEARSQVASETSQVENGTLELPTQSFFRIF